MTPRLTRLHPQRLGADRKYCVTLTPVLPLPPKPVPEHRRPRPDRLLVQGSRPSDSLSELVESRLNEGRPIALVFDDADDALDYMLEQADVSDATYAERLRTMRGA